MTKLWWTVLAAAGLWATVGMGQGLVIGSLQGNGQLTWTNNANTSAVYRVEWAAQAEGPWHRFTPAGLSMIDAATNRQFSVAVPMFYRVVMETNPPPAGMAWIEGGSFQMGDDAGYADEVPAHPVTVSSFWMDVFEVNKAKWDEVYGWAITNGYSFDNVGASRNGDNLGSSSIVSNLPCYPVYQINWFDAVKWCNARSEMEGLVPAYQYFSFSFYFTYQSGQRSNLLVRSNGYRLPTEAEWEYAARGGRKGLRFPWGNTITHEWANYSAHPATYAYDVNPYTGSHAWFAVHAQYISQCGAGLPPNDFGLFDMAGNVQEICWDWYGSYTAGSQTNPVGPVSGTNRVVRGGAWNVDARGARCAARAYRAPENELGTIGFRCVRGP
jgi:formylglycine-generating enzyme